jgi:hypothetical protein
MSSSVGVGGNVEGAVMEVKGLGLECELKCYRIEE